MKHSFWQEQPNFIPEKLVLGRSTFRKGSASNNAIAFSCKMAQDGKSFWVAQTKFKRITGYCPHLQRDPEIQIVKDVTGAVWTIPNTPMSGFKLSTKFDVELTNSFSWFILEDPRGFEVEISASNLKHLVSDGVRFEGLELKGELVYSFEWKNQDIHPILVKTGSTKHEASLKATAFELEKAFPKVRLSPKNLEPFKIYVGTKAFEGEWIYLGKMDVAGHLAQEFSVEFNRWPLGEGASGKKKSSIIAELSKIWHKNSHYSYASFGPMTKNDPNIFGLKKNTHVFAKFERSKLESIQLDDLRNLEFLDSPSKMIAEVSKNSLESSEIENLKEQLSKAIWNKTLSFTGSWKPAGKEDIVEFLKALVTDTILNKKSSGLSNTCYADRFKNLLPDNDPAREEKSTVPSFLPIHPLRLRSIYNYDVFNNDNIFSCQIVLGKPGDTASNCQTRDICLEITPYNTFKLSICKYVRHWGRLDKIWTSLPANSLEDLVDNFFLDSEFNGDMILVPEIDVLDPDTKKIVSKLDPVRSMCMSRASLYRSLAKTQETTLKA